MMTRADVDFAGASHAATRQDALRSSLSGSPSARRTTVLASLFSGYSRGSAMPAARPADDRTERAG
jgi:hypothetical protein